MAAVNISVSSADLFIINRGFYPKNSTTMRTAMFSLSFPIILFDSQLLPVCLKQIWKRPMIRFMEVFTRNTKV